MSFQIEFAAEVRLEIRNWNLPELIDREFYLKFANAAESEDFLEHEKVYEMESGDYEYRVTVEASNGIVYVFSPRMLLRPNYRLWVYDCGAFSTANRSIIWSSVGIDVPDE